MTFSEKMNLGDYIIITEELDNRYGWIGKVIEATYNYLDLYSIDWIGKTYGYTWQFITRLTKYRKLTEDEAIAWLI